MRWLGAGVVLGLALAGCGLNVQSADLFALTRTGQGKPLTLLVNDGGTVRCDGGSAKQLPDQLLLQARDLATSLDNDAKAKLRVPASAGTVASYTVKLQDGTVSFPDTAGSRHAEFAQAELFALQVAQRVCGLPG
jgi:hypothetical protein